MHLTVESVLPGGPLYLPPNPAWLERLARTEEGRALLSERPNFQPSDDDLVALLALPSGTLGNALASY